MKTTKPISTISYNSKDFLECQLDSLIERNIISFYAFIYHFKEDDETKNHIHLYIIPNGGVNTDNWKSYFDELDPNNPTKPLSVLPWERSCHFGDWFLYVSHDKDYLATKMQTRKYVYNRDSFITSNKDYFLELIHKIDFSKYTKQKELLEKIKSTDDVVRMVEDGVIPMTQFNNYMNYVLSRIGNNTYRNGRDNHEEIDTDTGEYYNIENLVPLDIPSPFM